MNAFLDQTTLRPSLRKEGSIRIILRGIFGRFSPSSKAWMIREFFLQENFQIFGARLGFLVHESGSLRTVKRRVGGLWMIMHSVLSAPRPHCKDLQIVEAAGPKLIWVSKSRQCFKYYFQVNMVILFDLHLKPSRFISLRSQGISMIVVIKFLEAFWFGYQPRWSTMEKQ